MVRLIGKDRHREGADKESGLFLRSRDSSARYLRENGEAGFRVGTMEGLCSILAIGQEMVSFVGGGNCQQ
jgi:hypothetical protein